MLAQTIIAEIEADLAATKAKIAAPLEAVKARLEAAKAKHEAAAAEIEALVAVPAKASLEAAKADAYVALSCKSAPEETRALLKKVARFRNGSHVVGHPSGWYRFCEGYSEDGSQLFELRWYTLGVYSSDFHLSQAKGADERLLAPLIDVDLNRLLNGAGLWE